MNDFVRIWLLGFWSAVILFVSLLTLGVIIHG